MTDAARFWRCASGDYLVGPERLLPKLEDQFGVKVDRPATDQELADATAWFGPGIHVRYMKLRLSVAVRDAEYKSLKADASAERDKVAAEAKRVAADERADRLIRISRGEEP